jgi:motility quorum-sensing regulator/GCU-specific mRNA interferase toxin
LEKLRASHDLGAFKAAFSRHRGMTGTALKSALALGYDVDDVNTLLQRLDQSGFVKSMTSYGDHRQWQDVYHLRAGSQLLYVKFTESIVTDFVLLSFKEQ